MIKLENDLDYSRIFARRPSFDINVESLIAHVWLSLPCLHFHLMNHQILFLVGSIFGRPLQIDQATASMTRLFVVCILVELDATKNTLKKCVLDKKNMAIFEELNLKKCLFFVAIVKCMIIIMLTVFPCIPI